MLSRSTQVWRTNCKPVCFSLQFSRKSFNTVNTKISSQRTLLRFPRWTPYISFTLLVKPRFADTWFLGSWAPHTSQAHTSCCKFSLLERALKAPRKEPLQTPEVLNWPSREGGMGGFSGVWLHKHHLCKHSQQGQGGTWEVPFTYFYLLL